MKSKCVTAAATISMSILKGLYCCVMLFLENHAVLLSACSHPIANIIFLAIIFYIYLQNYSWTTEPNIIRGTQTFTHWDFQFVNDSV